MAKQTWTITATPRERLQLAILLLHRDLKVRGRADERKLYRVRQALGLIAISEALLANQYELGANSYQHDNTTRHRFTVTIENAEWILKAIEPLELNSAVALFVEPLLQRLEAQEDDDQDAGECVETEEIPKWKPKQLPDPPRDDDQEAPPPAPTAPAPAASA